MADYTTRIFPDGPTKATRKRLALAVAAQLRERGHAYYEAHSGSQLGRPCLVISSRYADQHRRSVAQAISLVGPTIAIASSKAAGRALSQ